MSLIKKCAQNILNFEQYSYPSAKKYYFLDNLKNNKNLLIVLAGYKKELWNNVFKRLEKYVSKNIDVCLVSSGIYSDFLNNLAQKNKWSYLSIKRNNINLAQNTAINLFPKAQNIIKMDEDIFLTQGTLQNLIYDFEKIKKECRYDVGTISPLINLNGYSYLRILQLFNKVDQYEKLFGKATMGGKDKPIENSTDVARFMWGYNNYLPSIDEMNKELSQLSDLSYTICPIRLTIGLFMMSRSFWKEMGMYKVRRVLNDFGKDERQINEHSILNSEAMVIDERCVVGHFSFHYQDKEMVKLYKEHPEYFKM